MISDAIDSPRACTGCMSVLRSSRITDLRRCVLVPRNMAMECSPGGLTRVITGNFNFLSPLEVYKCRNVLAGARDDKRRCGDDEIWETSI